METLVVQLKFSELVSETRIDKAVETLAAASRSERGCINYDVYKNSEDTHTVIFIENWASEGDLMVHKKAEGILNFKKDVGEFIELSKVISAQHS